MHRGPSAAPVCARTRGGRSGAERDHPRPRVSIGKPRVSIDQASASGQIDLPQSSPMAGLRQIAPLPRRARVHVAGVRAARAAAAARSRPGTPRGELGAGRHRRRPARPRRLGRAGGDRSPASRVQPRGAARSPGCWPSVVLRPPDLRHLDAAFSALATSPHGETSLRLAITELFATTLRLRAAGPCRSTRLNGRRVSPSGSTTAARSAATSSADRSTRSWSPVRPTASGRRGTSARRRSVRGCATASRSPTAARP